MDERESLVTKALNWVLRRTVEEGKETEEGNDDKLVTDAEGWVDCDDVVSSTPTLFIYLVLTMNSLNKPTSQLSRLH